VSSYLLAECIEDVRYYAERCERMEPMLRFKMSYSPETFGPGVLEHGPAVVNVSTPPIQILGDERRLAVSHFSYDNVYCVRCMSWPSQAADWPTRQRNHGWPESATVARVVSDGCDVVGAAHRQCRQDEWMNKYQHRLSFSRAEITLLNGWEPVQQIVYHMLRFYVKTERLTDSAGESESETLSNYHIKTLMLWACELKPRSWWTDDVNVVKICVQLLHTLAVWLTDARCQHYFIDNCNLFDHFDNWQITANRLKSETTALLAEWFIGNYIRKCAAELCPGHISRLFDDTTHVL